MKPTNKLNGRSIFLKYTLGAMTVFIALFLQRPALALAVVESRTSGDMQAAQSHSQREDQEFTTPRAEHTSENLSASRSSVPNTPEQKNLRYMVNQLEGLQKEVSNLRGILEEQQQEIKQLKKRQESFYQDIDKRLGKSSENANVKAAPAKSPPLALQSPVTASEQDSYQVAYNLLRSKRYAEALTAFQDFNKRYPKSDQAPNACYWVGEIYFLQWQMDKNNLALLDKAGQSFTALKNNFTQHTKVSDALYKLGLIEKEKGNVEASSEYFKELKSKYPQSSAARLAG